MPRRLVPLAFAALVAMLLASCGDYKPCEVLAKRICDECPSVSKPWQAACLCIQYSSTKEEGYLCLKPSEEDEVRCNASLANWDEQTCDLLN